MRFTAWLVLAATLILWSGNWIVARAVREEITPGLATVGRLIVVLAILLPFVFQRLKAKLPQLVKRDWLIIAALGVAGGGPHLGFQWLGLHFTTAANAVLYLSTTPIFILLISLAMGERIVGRQWLGVAISFIGVLVVATHGNVAALSFNVGDLLAIMSMVLWACYTVLLGMRRDPLGVIELLAMVCVFGLIFMLPWVGWELAHGAKVALSVNGTLAILYSAVCSLLIAYAGWSYVVARLGPARAGVTMHLMPAIGVGMSILFLGEYPRWFHFAGIALILGGVTLSSGFPSGRRPGAPARAADRRSTP